MTSGNTNKKVAILADPLDMQSAGIHVYLKMLLADLHKCKGIEYHLIRAKASSEDFGLKNIAIPIRKFPGSVLWRKWISLPRFLNKQNYDAVIEPAHFGPFNLKEDTKRVTIIHDITPIILPQFHKTSSVIGHKIFLSRILNKADLIIANSRHTLGDIRKFFPESKGSMQFIYPRINPIFKKTDNREVLDKYGIIHDYFLSVGTIEPRKNYLLTVKAFEDFKKRRPDSRHQLIIIGRKGWKSLRLAMYIANSNYKRDIRIINDVQTEELPAFYSHCKLFILSSHYEGFGFPILEAHNCGARCILSDNSSIREIASDFAYFFKSNDQHALCELIDNTLQNQEEKRKGAEIYNEDFSQRFNQALLKVLED